MVSNTRNNHANNIWFHIEEQITKWIEQGYCLYICNNLCDTKLFGFVEDFTHAQKSAKGFVHVLQISLV